MKSYDWILYAIIAAFLAWEGVAHWILHNRQGHTASNRIEAIEKKWGIPARIVVAAATVALGVHLQGAF